MITLAPVTTQNVLLCKMVRLQALQDTPSAFNSTYARETAFTDAAWDRRHRRSGQMNTRLLPSKKKTAHHDRPK